MGNNYSSVQDLEERNLSAMSVANWGQKWVDFSFEGSFLFSCTSTQLSRKKWLRFQLITYMKDSYCKIMNSVQFFRENAGS